jgi:CheY-like chemotaxis protein
MDHQNDNKILVVTGEIFHREVIATMLEPFQCEPVFVDDVATAQKQIFEDYFSMVLVGDESGELKLSLEWIRHLRSDPSFDDLVIIFMDSEKSASVRCSAVECGTDLFLAKPITHDELSVVMASARRLIKERFKWVQLV